MSCYCPLFYVASFLTNLCPSLHPNSVLLWCTNSELESEVTSGLQVTLHHEHGGDWVGPPQRCLEGTAGGGTGTAWQRLGSTCTRRTLGKVQRQGDEHNMVGKCTRVTAGMRPCPQLRREHRVPGTGHQCGWAAPGGCGHRGRPERQRCRPAARLLTALQLRALPFQRKPTPTEQAVPGEAPTSNHNFCKWP